MGQAAVHIAHVIAAGGPDKGHVNPPLPPLDGAGPATVGFEHHRLGRIHSLEIASASSPRIPLVSMPVMTPKRI